MLGIRICVACAGGGRAGRWEERGRGGISSLDVHVAKLVYTSNYTYVLPTCSRN